MALNPYFGRKQTGLNPYFSLNNENFSNDSEFDITTSLMEEQIQIFGYKTTYILRTHNTLDDLYGDSIGSVFKDSFPIEMMPESSDLMQGKDTIAVFGYSMQDTVVLQVSLRRLTEEIKKLGIPNREYPMVGDLIKFDVPGCLLEIKYIEDKVVPFPQGHYYMYALYTQVFSKSDETFDTGDPDIDFLNQFDKVYEEPTMDNEKIKTEAQEHIIQEPNIWNLDFSNIKLGDK